MAAPAILRPLGERRLALLWGGLATSAMGDQLFLVALSWVAVQALGADAGYLTALSPLTILVVALGAGHFADRMRPLRLMVLADLGRAGLLAGLVVAWLADGRPPAWALVATVAGLAAGVALFRPALQAAIRPVVADVALLPAANALLETTDRIARLLGPGLVAVLGAAVPAVHFVSIDVATFVVSAGCVAVVMRGHAVAFDAVETGTLWHSLTRGFRAMRGHPILRFTLLVNAAPTAGIWYAVMFLGVPLMAAQDGGHGLAGFGLVVSSYGSTNLLANVLIGGVALPRRPGSMVFGADLVMGTGLAAMGLASMLLPGTWRLPGMCAAAALAAIGGPMSDIPVAVLRQTRLPPADQAAAMRALLVAFNLGTLAALAVAPAAIRALGVDAAVVGGAAVIFGCGVVGLVRHAATPG